MYDDATHGATWTGTSEEPWSPAPTPAERVVAGRYTLLGSLGQGGGGTVHEARDRLTGRLVAVKTLTTLGPAGRRRARREVAALRYLRIPGVVRLLDDGFEGDERFIVMERLYGTEWLPGGNTWSEVEGPLLQLLDTLARVHALGIVHRDLKPGNVLIVEGRPVVLDFGIALGRALAPPQTGASEGTLAYMAPEQRWGRPADARADLYSLGQMTRKALTSSPPAGGAPPAVRALLDRLVAEDPDARPASAEEVLAALGGARPGERVAAVIAGLPDPAPRPALEALFRGPDVFQHLREDGASLLLLRTGGEPAAIGRELERWIRSGHASIEGETVVVDRLALDRLSLDEVAVARAPADVLLDAEARAAALGQEGRLPLALVTLELALGLARSLEDEPAERRLLARLVDVALRCESTSTIDPAVYEVERSGIAGVEPLAVLLRAQQAVLSNEGWRVREPLAKLDPLPDEDLEIWREGLQVRAMSPAEAVAHLRGRAGWIGGSALRAAKVQGWLGDAHYAQGDYAGSARLHLASAEARTRPVDRFAARYNAARALLEVSPDAALPLAEDVAHEAASRRLVVYEALATTVVRSAVYRLGLPSRPRPELVAPEVLGGVGAVGAALLLVEAAVAWRAGEANFAHGLAARAAGLFQEQGAESFVLLAESLAAAATAPHAPEALVALAARAEHCPMDDVATQVYGLLCLAASEPRPDWRAAAARRAARVATPFPDRRIDVLSLQEAVGASPPLTGRRHTC